MYGATVLGAVRPHMTVHTARLLVVVALFSSCSQNTAPLVDVEQLARDFNAAPGAKLVAVYSPRCATCAGSAGALQRALARDADKALRVWLVWVPIERFDSIRGLSAEALGYVTDKRASQVWDASLSVPEALCRFDSLSSACKDSSATLWGWVGLWPTRARWGTRPAWAAFDPGEAQLAASGLGQPD